MCIGDWRLGRLITTQTQWASVANGSNLAVGSNQQRVGISFGLDTTSTLGLTRVQLSTNTQIVTALNAGVNWQHFTLAQHGRLPMQQWTALSVGAAFIICITEYFMPEEYLQAGVDEYRRMMKEMYEPSEK